VGGGGSGATKKLGVRSLELRVSWDITSLWPSVKQTTLARRLRGHLFIELAMYPRLFWNPASGQCENKLLGHQVWSGLPFSRAWESLQFQLLDAISCFGIWSIAKPRDLWSSTNLPLLMQACLSSRYLFFPFKFSIQYPAISMYITVASCLSCWVTNKFQSDRHWAIRGRDEQKDRD
jgi:hypothetical protein